MVREVRVVVACGAELLRGPAMRHVRSSLRAAVRRRVSNGQRSGTAYCHRWDGRRFHFVRVLWYLRWSTGAAAWAARGCRMAGAVGPPGYFGGGDFVECIASDSTPGSIVPSAWSLGPKEASPWAPPEASALG